MEYNQDDFRTVDEMLKDYKRRSTDIDYMLKKLKEELEYVKNMLNSHIKNNEQFIGGLGDK